jgi:hypothetical protein
VPDVSGERGGSIVGGFMCSADGTTMLYWNIRHQSSGVML